MTDRTGGGRGGDGPRFADGRGVPLDDPTVLVVDDEPDVADVYADQIRDYYTVRRAYGGEEALDAVDDDVDVVLLDRRMPFSGDEVLAAIREAGHDCRVVMVTAIEPDFDIVDMPFDDYVTKPVSRTHLLAVVETQLVYAAFHEALDEYLGARSKLDVLEDEKSAARRDQEGQYDDLVARTERLRADLERMIAEYDELDVDPEALDDADPDTGAGAGAGHVPR